MAGCTFRFGNYEWDFRRASSFKGVNRVPKHEHMFGCGMVDSAEGEEPFSR